MKRYLISFAAVALVAALAMLALQPGSNTSAAGPPQVVSGFGTARVQGQDAVVHVVVVVPAGENARAAVETALHAQGARPLSSADFSLTGMVWAQFTGGATGSAVVQNYNPLDDPTGAGQDALTATHGTWTGAGNTNFDFDFGVGTSRCPSLVQECSGAQTPDGNNDVAWLALSGGNTLGVTWFMTSGPPEADMALNTAFRWTTDGAEGREPGCRGPSKKCNVFDAQTVFLHENGHVAGLGHSSVQGAVMEPAYEGSRRLLHADDIAGITALYGSGGTSTTEGATLDVGVTTDKTSYVNRERVSITVVVSDGAGSPNPVDAAVTVEIQTASGKFKLTGTGDTGADGEIVFTYKVTRRDGTGTFTVIATAAKEGFEGGSDTTTFEVN